MARTDENMGQIQLKDWWKWCDYLGVFPVVTVLLWVGAMNRLCNFMMLDKWVYVFMCSAVVVVAGSRRLSRTEDGQVPVRLIGSVVVATFAFCIWMLLWRISMGMAKLFLLPMFVITLQMLRGFLGQLTRKVRRNGDGVLMCSFAFFMGLIVPGLFYGEEVVFSYDMLITIFMSMFLMGLVMISRDCHMAGKGTKMGEDKLWAISMVLCAGMSYYVPSAMCPFVAGLAMGFTALCSLLHWRNYVHVRYWHLLRWSCLMLPALLA